LSFLTWNLKSPKMKSPEFHLHLGSPLLAHNPVALGGPFHVTVESLHGSLADTDYTLLYRYRDIPTFFI